MQHENVGPMSCKAWLLNVPFELQALCSKVAEVPIPFLGAQTLTWQVLEHHIVYTMKVFSSLTMMFDEVKVRSL